MCTHLTGGIGQPPCQNFDGRKVSVRFLTGLPAIFFCALKAHCDANLLKSMTKTRSVRVESKAFSPGEALYCRLRMGKDGVKRLLYSQKMLVITMS